MVKRILGILCILAPFLVLTCYMAQSSIYIPFFVWGVTVFIVGIFMLGFYLLDS